MEFSLFITEPPAEQDPLSVENPSSPFSVFDEFSSSFPSSIDPQIISSPDDHIASSPDYYSSPTIGVEESSQCSRFDDFGRGITENGSFYSSTAVAPSTTLPEDCSQHQQQQPVYQLLHQNPSSFQQPPFFPPQTLPPQAENGKELFSFEKSSEVFPKKENSQQHSLFSAPPPSTKEEKQSYSSESRKRKRRAKVAAARASRRLPEKEGVEPLLLAETSETKEQKRRRKNRESAARCRAEVKEKLDKFEKLELRVKELEEENRVLRAALLRGQQSIPVQFPPAETVSYPDPFWQQGGTPQFKSAAAFSLCVVLFAFGMIFSSFALFGGSPHIVGGNLMTPPTFETGRHLQEFGNSSPHCSTSPEQTKVGDEIRAAVYALKTSADESHPAEHLSLSLPSPSEALLNLPNEDDAPLSSSSYFVCDLGEHFVPSTSSPKRRDDNGEEKSHFSIVIPSYLLDLSELCAGDPDLISSLNIEQEEGTYLVEFNTEISSMTIHPFDSFLNHHEDEEGE
eukprot:CAMPEP_0201475200 /NCGR_PEP_ID=MMETSP0151_2-20130828/656_1 /ASSEMBLY_ACC=CAM_ASM_000257 /TAXON_ID=200890 /ORGANISM="Paramoeba atlantica, Strain 621/1 / CCAP 1560/9" /LENGTH=510 /DNA_ID=CAMNT_0047855227 /DNA_START=97 /DNA_END=1629 /DNA_ORIENTATION=-